MWVCVRAGHWRITPEDDAAPRRGDDRGGRGADGRADSRLRLVGVHAANARAGVGVDRADREISREQTRLAVYQNPATRPWDGDTAHVPCWVRRIDEQRFQVFAINCTHLGCPVRWFPESKLFMCPCHGGAFYEDGSHASGPPPRGLFEYEHKVENGSLMVVGGHIPTLAEPL